MVHAAAEYDNEDDSGVYDEEDDINEHRQGADREGEHIEDHRLAEGDEDDDDDDDEDEDGGFGIQ